MRFLILATLALALGGSARAQQTAYFVSPTGDDGAAGTSRATAWRTVQHAMNEAPAGAVVELADGTYAERVQCNVSGTAADPIVFRATNARRAILDGGSSGDEDAVLAIRNQSYVRVEGLAITNNNQLDAQGILVEGACRGITLADNEISEINFSSDASDEASEGRNAQPLIVYGTDGASPITDLVIENNLVRDSRPGYSEALAINGNVTGFRVSGNTVHDISNIGIDIIGHEGTAPADDQARDGLIADNFVYNCRSPYATAAGIYVDGGKDITIERNRITTCQWGIEIGAEAVGKTTEGITVRSNFIYLNDDAGLQIGGFDYPDGSGRVVGSDVVGNSFYANDAVEDGVGEVTGELSVSATDGVRIVGNIFWVANPAGLALYSEEDNPGVGLDYNIWYATDAIEFELGSKIYPDFTAYQAGVLRDGNGSFADPKFLNPGSGDLHLAGDSPAKDAGDPDFTPADATDFDGEQRVANGRVDVGADESGSTSSVTATSASREGVRVLVAGDKIRLLGLPSAARLDVYDRTGRRLSSTSGDILDAGTWRPGVYFVRYTTREGSGTLPVAID